MAIKDFGAKIPGTFDVPEGAAFQLNRKLIEELQAAQDYAIRWMTAKQLHFLHMGILWRGEPAPAPDPMCYFCSWAYKFYHFWGEIEFWSSECKGCGTPMYVCGQRCALWEEY